MARESKDSYDLMEVALHIVAAEDIMGLKETRTLPEILRKRELSPQERIALSFYATYVVQDGLQDYLTNHQIVLEQLLNRDLQTQKGIETLFNTKEGRLLRTMELLEQLNGSLKQLCRSLRYRIL